MTLDRVDRPMPSALVVPLIKIGACRRAGLRSPPMRISCSTTERVTSSRRGAASPPQKGRGRPTRRWPAIFRHFWYLRRGDRRPFPRRLGGGRGGLASLVPLLHPPPPRPP